MVSPMSEQVNSMVSSQLVSSRRMAKVTALQWSEEPSSNAWAASCAIPVLPSLSAPPREIMISSLQAAVGAIASRTMSATRIQELLAQESVAQYRREKRPRGSVTRSPGKPVQTKAWFSSLMVTVELAIPEHSLPSASKGTGTLNTASQLNGVVDINNWLSGMPSWS